VSGAGLLFLKALLFVGGAFLGVFLFVTRTTPAGVTRKGNGGKTHQASQYNKTE
jgi:hypothetical protein